jgi:hypothetical protein
MGNRFAAKGRISRATHARELELSHEAQKEAGRGEIAQQAQPLEQPMPEWPSVPEWLPYQNVRAHCRRLPGGPVNTRKTTAAYTGLEECTAFGEVLCATIPSIVALECRLTNRDLSSLHP